MKVLTIKKSTSKPSFKNTTLVWKSEMEKIIKGKYTHVEAKEQNGTLIHGPISVDVYKNLYNQGDFNQRETLSDGDEFFVFDVKNVNKIASSIAELTDKLTAKPTAKPTANTPVKSVPDRYIDETGVTYDLDEINSGYGITRNGKTISNPLRKKHKTKLQAETYLKNVLKAKPI